MLVVGLQGSPRKKGNTEFLLSLFLEEARKQGARTVQVDVCGRHIEPCKEFTTCEKKGYCPIKDDMDPEIYALLREADVIVPASPVFFYNVTAQLKALIDRSQTLWARKYRLNLSDPKRSTRNGFILAQGATKGKNLFVGIDLTARYFFDAVGADYAGSLYYWQIENRGDMARHSTVREDVAAAVSDLLTPMFRRTRVLFICRENAGRSQIASALAQYLAGEHVEALSAGSAPADQLNPVVTEAMAEKGIDMAFRFPRTVESALEEGMPEVVVSMGCGDQCPQVPGARVIEWDLPDPAGRDLDFVRGVRDDIEGRVKSLIHEITGA